MLKCLRKDPADRYGTAEALGQDLRRLVRGDPIEARPQSGWERFGSRVRRHRTKVAVGGAFLVLVLSLVWLVHAKRAADHEVQRLDHEARRLRYEPAVLELVKQIYAHQYSLQAVGGQLDDLFFKTTPSRSLARMTPQKAKALLGEDRGVHPVAQAAGELEGIAQLVAKPDAHYYLAKAHVLLRRDEDARSEIQKVLEHDPDFVPAKVLEFESPWLDETGSDFETVRPEDKLDRRVRRLSRSCRRAPRDGTVPRAGGRQQTLAEASSPPGTVD